MYTTSDFRNGLKIEFEGSPYIIVYFQHVKPGKVRPDGRRKPPPPVPGERRRTPSRGGGAGAGEGPSPSRRSSIRSIGRRNRGPGARSR